MRFDLNLWFSTHDRALFLLPEDNHTALEGLDFYVEAMALLGVQQFHVRERVEFFFFVVFHDVLFIGPYYSHILEICLDNCAIYLVSRMNFLCLSPRYFLVDHCQQGCSYKRVTIVVVSYVFEVDFFRSAASNLELFLAN